MRTATIGKRLLILLSFLAVVAVRLLQLRVKLYLTSKYLELL